MSDNKESILNSYGSLAYDRSGYEYENTYNGRSDLSEKSAIRQNHGRTYAEGKAGSGKNRTDAAGRPKTGAVKKTSGKAKTGASRKKSNERARIMLRRAVCIVMVASSAIFMISSYVRVSEGREQIAALQKTLTNEESKTSQKSYELEQSVDLSEIEKEATTRLGMQRPEKYQIIYINVATDDVTHTTSGNVEGIGHTLKNFFKKIGSDIIDYFSIK